MRLLRFIMALGCLLTPITVGGQTVTSKNGNIYFSPKSSGEVLQLTAKGLDREPNLSPDARLVVFVRSTPGQEVEGPTGPAEKTELWAIRTDGKEPRLLLKGGVETAPNGVRVAYFKSPQFSPDGAQVYFLSLGWVVSDAVYALNMKTGKLRAVCPANSLLVIRKGEYAGDLVVEQHRYFMGSGSYDWVYVVTPDGKEIGTLGDSDDPILKDRLKEILSRGNK
jgi:outer membrane protein assembly factor BamB